MEGISFNRYLFRTMPALIAETCIQVTWTSVLVFNNSIGLVALQASWELDVFVLEKVLHLIHSLSI